MSVLQTVTGGVSASTTLGLTIASTTPGTCLFLGVLSFSTGTAAAPTLVEAGSTSFVKQGTTYGTTDAGQISLYALENNAGGFTGITVEQAASADTTLSAVLIEVPGIQLYTPFDQSSAGETLATNAWSSGATPTTTNGYEFAIGFLGAWNDGTLSLVGPGGAWTNSTPREESVAGIDTYVMMGYQAVTTEQAFTYSGTGGSTEYWNTAKCWTFFQPNPAYPLIVGATATDETAASTTITVTLPAGLQDGDLVMVYIACDEDNASFSSDGGDFYIGEPVEAVGTKASGQILWTVANGGETTQEFINATGTSIQCAVAIAFRDYFSEGFDPVLTNSGVANATSSEVVAAASINTSYNDDLLVWIGMVAGETGTTKAPTITPPSGFTTLTSSYYTGATSANAGLLAAFVQEPIAGATGAKNGSITTEYPTLGFMIGIPPTSAPAITGSPTANIAFSLSCAGESDRSGAASTGVSYALTAAGYKQAKGSATSGVVSFSTAGTIGAPQGSSAATATINFTATAVGSARIPSASTTPAVHPVLSPFYARNAFPSGIYRTAHGSATWPYQTASGTAAAGTVTYKLSATGSKHGTGSPVATVTLVFTSTQGLEGFPVALVSLTAHGTAASSRSGAATAVINFQATGAGHARHIGSVTLGPVKFKFSWLRVPLDLAGTEIDANEYGGTATDTNMLGGAISEGYSFGGTCADANEFGYESLVQWGMAEVDIELLPEFNDETLDFTITNYGVAFNLNGYTVQAIFKESANVSDSDALFVFSTATTGVTITDMTTGEITVQIPNADVDTLNIGFYRIDVIDYRGNLNTAIYGNVTILPL